MSSTTAAGIPRMSPRELQAYWRRLSRDHLAASDDGFEVICYAGMPRWFNAFIHRYQVKAFRRLTAHESFAGCDVLDIGTGVGRWARSFSRWPGARVVGIDIEGDRLERAVACGAGPAYGRMSADALGFAPASFDVVNSITVLQHIGDEAKDAALGEIARVLRPGGRAIIFEVTDAADDAPHVFPRSETAWAEAFALRGFSLRRTVGTEYIPLLRALKRLHGVAAGTGARGEIDALKAGRSSARDRAKLAALRVAVAASYPLEEVSSVLPTSRARITGFLFVKGGA